ncbi:MAG TPA: hypothetical protein VMR62_21385 [Bryobacteraceae bacterium]|nr:hypothetical protein [Bryobacteraceae bacterium]
MRMLTWIALLPLIVAAPRQGQPTPESAGIEDSLGSFLRTYLKSPPWTETDPTTRHLHAFVDLDGDGTPEAVAYISGRSWCGSGGCTTLIFHRKGSSYRVVTRITISQAPIRVFAATSHGWRNISVWVSGGGILPGHQAELRFDGKPYPGNPSLPLARPLDAKSEGEIVISGPQAGTLLYP